jgi:hypothetical protein
LGSGCQGWCPGSPANIIICELKRIFTIYNQELNTIKWLDKLWSTSSECRWQ